MKIAFTLVTLAFVGLWSGSRQSDVESTGFGPAEAAPRTGRVTGTVTLEPPPPLRRRADRYAGGPAREVQPLSAVVYLRGSYQGAPPAGYERHATMVQQDSMFVPSTIALMVGGTVSFPNEDPIHHNVLSYSSSKAFDLGRFPQGESRDVTFDRVGVVEVACEVHKHMAGIILVTENPFHAVVADDGTFVIEGVPPGEYTMVSWHPSHREDERTITVTDGADTRVEVELKR